jgi:hypothetical protein
MVVGHRRRGVLSWRSSLRSCRYRLAKAVLRYRQIVPRFSNAPKTYPLPVTDNPSTISDGV